MTPTTSKISVALAFQRLIAAWDHYPSLPWYHQVEFTEAGDAAIECKEPDSDEVVLAKLEIAYTSRPVEITGRWIKAALEACASQGGKVAVEAAKIACGRPDHHSADVVLQVGAYGEVILP